MFLLLRKADYITGSGTIEITPVPRNASYSANPGETVVASDYIRNFIISKTQTIPDNIINAKPNTTTTTTDTENE